VSGEAMTTAEVAKELGVTRRMVNLMIKKGVLPAKRFGRAHVIDRAALRRFVERREKAIKP
jgi:excisionase family DNA binding protein